MFAGKLKGASGTFSGKVEAGTFEGGIIKGSVIIGGSIETDSTINVTTDATIGSKLYIKTNNFNDGIYFDTFAPQTSITVDPGGTIVVTPSLTTENIYCNNLSVINGASGSFSTPDKKTVVVSNGIVTDIY